MRLLDALLGRTALEVREAQTSSASAIESAIALERLLPEAGPVQSLGLATAFRCTALYALSTTQAPLITVRGNRRLPLPDWLRRPEAYGAGMRARALVEWLTVSMAGWGAGYLWATPVGDRSWSLRPITPSRVTAYINERTDARVWQVDGRRVEVADGPARLEGLLVVPFLLVPGVALPLGPLSAARLSMGEYLEVERYAGRIFARGTVSGGRLETDLDIPPETAERWAGTWQEKRDAGTIPVLGAGLRYVNDVLNPADAQWIQSREFDAQEVARWFGVPPRYLGLPSGDASTYATARDNDAQLMRFGVAGYADPIGDAFTSLLPPGRNETEDVRALLDLDGLLKGTTADRYALWSLALAAGWLTVDEVRASEGLGPLDPDALEALPTMPGQVTA